MENTITSSDVNHLQKIPAEILYMIFDYLPPRTLHYVVRLVCKRFAHILSRDGYFMVRFKKKYFKNNVDYPLFRYYNLPEDSNTWRNSQDITWTDMAVRHDVREHLWGSPENSFDHRIFGLPHATTVDTVLLFDNSRACVSGGRDRLLCWWNVEDIPEVGPLRPMKVLHEAHEGWIWNMTSHDEDSFFSCGWDTVIKRWNVSTFTCVQGIRTERPSMCLSSCPGFLTAGLHNGKLVLLDPRVAYLSHTIHEHKTHKGAIIDIKIWKDQVITIGEDRRMAVFDLRNQSTLLYRHVNCVHKTCPRCVVVYKDLCFIGDSKGFLNVFSINANYKPILCTKVGETRGVNALVPTMDGLVVGTSDVGIRILSSCLPIQIQKQINCFGEITSLAFKKNVMVAGCSNCHKCIHLIKGHPDYQHSTL